MCERSWFRLQRVSASVCHHYRSSWISTNLRRPSCDANSSDDLPRVECLSLYFTSLCSRSFVVFIDVLESDAERSETTSDLHQRHTGWHNTILHHRLFRNGECHIRQRIDLDRQSSVDRIERCVANPSDCSRSSVDEWNLKFDHSWNVPRLQRTARSRRLFERQCIVVQLDQWSARGRGSEEKRHDSRHDFHGDHRRSCLYWNISHRLSIKYTKSLRSYSTADSNCHQSVQSVRLFATGQSPLNVRRLSRSLLFLVGLRSVEIGQTRFIVSDRSDRHGFGTGRWSLEHVHCHVRWRCRSVCDDNLQQYCLSLRSVSLDRHETEQWSVRLCFCQEHFHCGSFSRPENSSTHTTLVFRMSPCWIDRRSREFSSLDGTTCTAHWSLWWSQPV